jgi:hypothetical protein
MMASLESVGEEMERLIPSAGGGPGTGLKARRFFTGSAEIGNFKSGASTTFSVAALPRATRMVWVW